MSDLKPKWKYEGVRVVHSNELDINTLRPGHEPRRRHHPTHAPAPRNSGPAPSSSTPRPRPRPHHGRSERSIYVVSGKGAHALGRMTTVPAQSFSRRRVRG